MAVIIDKGSDNSGGGGGTAFLSFIVGGLVLAAAIVGFFMWDNYKSGGNAPKADITITAPKAPTPASR